VIALVGARDRIELNDHMEHADAALIPQHACKLGFAMPTRQGGSAAKNFIT
jgi:hypothetical protein